MLKPDPRADVPPNPHPFRLRDGDAFGFADGVPVPVVPPTVYGSEDESGTLADDDAGRVRRETIIKFLSWITRDQSAEQVGRRCLVLAFAMHLDSAPQNLHELAERLGVSKTRAHQIVAALKLNAGNGAFSGDFEENEAAD